MLEHSDIYIYIYIYTLEQILSVLGIVKLENPPRDPTGRLREFEGYWMIKLNTLEPFGLNGINEYERIIKKQGLKIMFDEEISSEF